eukprot:7030965-Alexandrium_andersonii.AAC.1
MSCSRPLAFLWTSESCLCMSWRYFGGGAVGMADEGAPRCAGADFVAVGPEEEAAELGSTLASGTGITV